jgi:hypothetical protein
LEGNVLKEAGKINEKPKTEMVDQKPKRRQGADPDTDWRSWSLTLFGRRMLVMTAG